jgi:hypothetical protein
MHEDAHAFLHAPVLVFGKALSILGFARPENHFMGILQVLLFGGCGCRKSRPPI